MKLLLDFWWDLQTLYWLPRLVVGFLIAALGLWYLRRSTVDQVIPCRGGVWRDWPQSARILVNSKPFPVRGGTITYEWLGGDWLHVSSDFIEYSQAALRGNRLFLGPYHLHVIERDLAIDAYLCVRHHWRGLIRERLYTATRGLDRFYRRLILTAAVWGLAHYPSAVGGWEYMPHWRNVHVLRHAAEFMVKVKHAVLRTD